MFCGLLADGGGDYTLFQHRLHWGGQVVAHQLGPPDFRDSFKGTTDAIHAAAVGINNVGIRISAKYDLAMAYDS